MIRPLLLLLSLASCAVAQSPLTAPIGSFPALNVQVTVGRQQRMEKGSSYRKTMTILPKVTIEGAGRMVPIPAAEATMLIITMDTRAKYKEGTEAYNVLTTETIPIPAAKTGDRRAFPFAESTVSYDSWRDSTNVGGDVFKYYLFGLRDPATKTVIDIKTNNPPLATYLKANPDKREELLAIAKGGKFPAAFK
jgi:hypothetical protein